MSAPVIELLLAIAALYLIESVIAVRRDAVVLWSWAGRSARITRSERLPGSHARGLFLRPPLPPLGRVYQSAPWPVSFDLDGVGSISPQRSPAATASDGSDRFVPYADISDIATIGPDLIVGGAPIARCASDESARALAELLRHLSTVDRPSREAALRDAVDASLNRDAAHSVLTSTRGGIARARAAANALFLTMFVATPIAIVYLGLARTWPMLLAAVLLLWITATLLARGSHAAIFPERKAERRATVLVMALTPMAAIRAHDLLTRHALSRVHPLTAAAVLCGASTFRKFAESVLRDLSYPARVPETVSERARAAADFTRDVLKTAVESALRRDGLEPAELLAVPTPSGGDSRSYCPCCCSDFVLESGECETCRVPLAAFAAEGERAPVDTHGRGADLVEC